MITLLCVSVLILVVCFILSFKTTPDSFNAMILKMALVVFFILSTALFLHCVLNVNRTEQIKTIEPTLIRTNNTHTLIIYPDKENGFNMIVSKEARVYNAVEVWVNIKANYNHFNRRISNTYEIETLTLDNERR